MYPKILCILFLINFCCCHLFAQQPFTAGNIVVYRVGDGSTTLTSSAAPVFLDEYTQGGTLVQSIAMPTAPNGSHHRLTAKGTDEEGLLNLSANGQSLIVTGGNTAVGSVPGGTAGIIGVVDFNGKINTTTAVTDYNLVSGGMQLRSAASDDGKRFWFGRFDELRYTTLGSTTSTLIGNTGNYMTGFSIAEGQLYVALETPSPRIRKVGTGLPTTSGQTLTGLPGFGSASARSPKHFAFADLDASVPGVDVLYVADRGNSVEGGLRKFSLVGGSWVANGVIGSPADQYHGLTVSVSGSVVTVFATRLGANGSTTWGGELVKLVDNSGYNGALTTTPAVLSAVNPANSMSLRGVALVPQGCLPVLKLAAKDVTASQAQLSWQPPLAGASAYEYAITQSETPPASGTATNNTVVPVTGLSNDITYYAHVRTVCNLLSQSAWATISFKTGCIAPAAPSVTVTVTATGLATIRWNKAFGAASYQYVVSKSESVPVAGTAISDTFFTVPVDAVSKYIVYVRSDCGNNAFSAWAKASFSTNCLQPSVTLNLAGGNAVASWYKINNATRYEYALTKGAAKPLSGTYTTDTSYLIAKINQGAGYYFHCRAVCNTGVQSDWTTVPFHLKGMEAFPNPVYESFTLRIHGTVGSHPVISITNALGKQIRQLQMNGNSMVVDTRLWQSGVYFVHYQDGANTYVLKVMKKNER